jgi:hypothetical protein
MFADRLNHLHRPDLVEPIADLAPRPSAVTAVGSMRSHAANRQVVQRVDHRPRHTVALNHQTFARAVLVVDLQQPERVDIRDRGVVGRVPRRASRVASSSSATARLRRFWSLR